jgi:hypothetical protein
VQIGAIIVERSKVNNGSRMPIFWCVAYIITRDPAFRSRDARNRTSGHQAYVRKGTGFKKKLRFLITTQPHITSYVPCNAFLVDRHLHIIGENRHAVDPGPKRLHSVSDNDTRLIAQLAYAFTMAGVQAQQKFVEEVCPRCNSVRRKQEFPSTPFNDHLDKVYSPLKSIGNEIRLLKISSGLEDEPLMCILEPISLDGDVLYTALSYCWGDANNRADIKVNGQSVSVTISLENALRRIRNVAQDTMVWADAICINQQDMAEKSVQVSMMGSIYSKGVLRSMKGVFLANQSFSNRCLDLAWRGRR